MKNASGWLLTRICDKMHGQQNIKKIVPKHWQETTILHCVKSHKSADLIYTVAEA
jgi:predicted transposase YbfD/YdcC